MSIAALSFFFRALGDGLNLFFSVKRFRQLDPSVKVAGSCARNWRSEGEDLVWITGLKSVSKKSAGFQETNPN